MQRIILIAFLGIIVCSCGGTKQQIVSTQEKIIDSTSVEKTTRTRDSIIKVPKSQVDFTWLLNDIQNNPLTASNGRAKVIVYREKDSIHTSCVCDSLEIQVQLKDSIINTLRTKIKEKTIIPAPVIEYKTKWYVNILAWIGGIFSALVAGGFIFSIIKSKFL